MGLSKDEKQDEFINLWGKNGGRGSLVAATGFGKTVVAVKIVKKMLVHHPNRRFLVVVPKIELKKQWEDAFNGIAKVDVRVINGLVEENKSLQFDLLILDEYHNYASPKFRNVFKIIKYKFLLGLTATIERLDGEHTLLETYAPVLMRIPRKEAMENKWISGFEEYNYGHTMTEDEMKRYTEIQIDYNKYFKMFKFNYDQAKRCLSKDWSEEYAFRQGWNRTLPDDHQWSPKRIQYYAMRFNKAVSERKHFLYNLPSKISLIKQIYEKYPVKTIHFCESTSFADKVASVIPQSTVYHTNIKGEKVEGSRRKGKKTKMDEAIEDIKSGKANFMSSSKALDEGLDVPDLYQAIISSYTSNPKQYQQRGGRATRLLKSDPNKVARIITIYTIGTQEEKWVKAAQQGAFVETIYSLDQLDDSHGVSFAITGRESESDDSSEQTTTIITG